MISVGDYTLPIHTRIVVMSEEQEAMFWRL